MPDESSRDPVPGSGNDVSSNDEALENDNEGPQAFVQRKRARSTKACISCHNRKVKCDVANKSSNSKCTNCLYSGSECVIYVRKKRSANKKRALSMPPLDEEVLLMHSAHPASRPPEKDGVMPQTSSSGVPSKLSNLVSSGDPAQDNSKDPAGTNGAASNKDSSKTKANDVSILSSNLNDLDSCNERKPSSNIPNFALSFLKPSGHVEYPHISAIKLDPNVVLKENMHELMKTEFGINENKNHFMKEILDSALSKITESYKRTYSLSQSDYQILNELGCFTIPDEETCWRFIDNFFEYINPQLPIIDKTNFYETYTDLRNPPSLLLLNSVLFVGAWHTNSESENPEEQFESVRIAQIFLKRARFLYEYSIECEPIALIQSLLCFCFNNENMSNIAKNDYYWIHTAVGVAYAYNLHQKPASSLTPYKRKMYKRLYWILFFKDRITAFGYSRPSAINVTDCDQEMLTFSDLSNSGMTHLEQIYLINLVKFGKLLDKIGAIQHEITKLYTNKRPVLHLMKKCDLIMIKFLQNLPKELKFKFNDKSTHSFLSLMSLSQYYTLLIVIHRANILRHSADVYPSWAITFQAVQMIKLLSDCLVAKNLIKKVALLSHNTLTSPAIIMLYHLLNEDEKISKIANEFFLRILGIWRATYRKFPVVYPMMCIFGYIYNSEEHLKEIVKSVAPKYNSAGNSPGNIAKADVSQEPNKAPLKLPDLSFIVNPGFRIHNMVDPFNLNSDPNASKFEDLGVNFDKLFSESVFAKGETLVPKLDLESISRKSKLRPQPQNQMSPNAEMSADKDAKVDDIKIKTETIFSNPDTPSTKSEINSESVSSRAPMSTNNNASDFNSTSMPTSTAPLSALDYSLQSDDYAPQTNHNSDSFSDLNNLMMSNSMLNLDDNQGYESKMQTSNIDIPISLWMMKANWKPKFNVNLEETSDDLEKSDKCSAPDSQLRDNDYESEKVGKVENFYGDVYQIMGGAYNELREDDNSEGGSVMNSNNDTLYPSMWNQSNNSKLDDTRYQLPNFDRFSHVNMPPSESADTLHKYRYNLNRHSDSTLLSSTVPNIQSNTQAQTFQHQPTDHTMPQPHNFTGGAQSNVPPEPDIISKISNTQGLHLPVQPGAPPLKLAPQSFLLNNLQQQPLAQRPLSQQQHNDYYQEQSYRDEAMKRHQSLQSQQPNKRFSQENMFATQDYGKSVNNYNTLIPQQQPLHPQQLSSQQQPTIQSQSQAPAHHSLYLPHNSQLQYQPQHQNQPQHLQQPQHRQNSPLYNLQQQQPHPQHLQHQQQHIQQYQPPPTQPPQLSQHQHPQHLGQHAPLQHQPQQPQQPQRSEQSQQPQQQQQQQQPQSQP